MMEKLILLIQRNKFLKKKKIEDVDKKILDNRKFIETKVFNRLIKINFNVRMTEISKKLRLNLVDENREKM